PSAVSMPAWTITSANLSVHRNSTILSSVSLQRPRTLKTIWHPSCSTTSRRPAMRSLAVKKTAGLLFTILILPAVIYGQATTFDYSTLYEVASPAVVQVTTDDGSGSGFLVTPFGHIATNFHVIRNSRYLAVQFPDGRKVKAAVVGANPRYDMAVLKVNSDVVDGVAPLRVLSEQ